MPKVLQLVWGKLLLEQRQKPTNKANSRGLEEFATQDPPPSPSPLPSPELPVKPLTAASRLRHRPPSLPSGSRGRRRESTGHQDSGPCACHRRAAAGRPGARSGSRAPRRPSRAAGSAWRSQGSAASESLVDTEDSARGQSAAPATGSLSRPAGQVPAPGPSARGTAPPGSPGLRGRPCGPPGGPRRASRAPRPPATPCRARRPPPDR